MDWRRERQCLLLAVQFLTRLPTPRDVAFSDAAQARAMRYHPLVGLLIGALGASVLAMAAAVLPMTLAVLLSTAATIWATGALHEDGLADCADGLGGGQTRDRALEIMRDSRIGAYGVLTMGLTLAIKVAALAAFPVPLACTLLIAAHALSRMVPVHIVARHEYARSGGAKFAPPEVSSGSYRVAALTVCCVAFFLLFVAGPGVTLTASVTGALTCAILTRLYLRKLGGYTGDCLGASQQVAECGFYLGALAWVA